jgi:hypothetical protein
MPERRYFVRYGASPTMHAIVHTDGSLHWPSALPAPEFRAEIPPQFWGFSLADVVAFYEQGIKPRLRVRLMDHRLPRELVCE